MQLNLKPYDLKNIKDDYTVLIVGRRGSGKSTILRNIMYSKRHIPMGLACSGTEEGNGFFSDFLPSTFVYKGYNSGAVQRLIERQQSYPKESKPNVFCVLDDCMFEPGVLKRVEMRDMFMNGRHYNAFFCTTCQFMMDVPTYARGNVDVIFVCRETQIGNRKRLWEQYFGQIPFPAFCKLLDATTQDYEVLVLDNRVQTNKPEEMYFYFKARTDIPPFRVGSKAFWRFHEEQEERAKKAGVTTTTSKTSRVTLTIRKVDKPNPKPKPKKNALQK